MSSYTSQIVDAYLAGRRKGCHGRKACNNLWTDGESIYSYGVCLFTGHVFNTGKYSITTTRHQTDLSSELRNRDILYVDFDKSSGTRPLDCQTLIAESRSRYPLASRVKDIVAVTTRELKSAIKTKSGDCTVDLAEARHYWSEVERYYNFANEIAARGEYANDIYYKVLTLAQKTRRYLAKHDKCISIAKRLVGGGATISEETELPGIVQKQADAIKNRDEQIRRLRSEIHTKMKNLQEQLFTLQGRAGKLPTANPSLVALVRGIIR